MTTPADGPAGAEPRPSRRGGPNRLAAESSPYLLQHAGNPVDWRPWGEEAFAEARRRDVPIFLSIGYSTCYWCHVMERESFEDEATARQMNDAFVCVKVDREERPDVDDLYMHAVQALAGHGGWPLSVFVEPRRLRPFFGGTYYPPEPRHGLPSFRQVLAAMAAAWRDQRDDVLRQADALAEVVGEHLAAAAAPRAVGREQVAQAVTTLLRAHDRAWGGFGGGDPGRVGGGPKFPQPAYLDLLLQFRPHAGDAATRDAVDAAVRLTLDRMALGGLFDQVGGGFHRYSVDGRWIVPHFEKMLYDNGLLAATYARAAAVYSDPFYARVARRTLDYALAEMASPEGAFYSAQDAEVDGREGDNYLWTPDDLAAALSADDAALAARVYGVDRAPNFRDPHHSDDPPRSVLWLERRPGALAADLGLSPDDLEARLDRINAALYAARRRRKQPSLDDKVLVSWNGLMIAGLAAGAGVLREERYLRAAERAARFILSTMRDRDGGLLRAWRRGRAAIPALLEDHAMLIHGLAHLCRAGADADGSFLRAAIDLADRAEALFGDPASGAFYDTPPGRDDLFVRARSTYDGAVPSGVSVMANGLLDLDELGAGDRWLGRAAACLASLSGAIAASPVGSVNSTRALLRMLTSERSSAALAAALAGAPAAAPTASRAPAPAADAVHVFASTDRVVLGEGEAGAAGLILEIRIADAFHVTAADPGPGGRSLAGLRVAVIDGEGVVAHADYPPGEPAGPDGELRVYRGTIRVPVVLERRGEWIGRPALAVRYQACTETECLAPVTVGLGVAIERDAE
jgi:uncharacterized protein YyaL (SSP411 family)